MATIASTRRELLKSSSLLGHSYDNARTEPGTRVQTTRGPNQHVIETDLGWIVQSEHDEDPGTLHETFENAVEHAHINAWLHKSKVIVFDNQGDVTSIQLHREAQ